MDVLFAGVATADLDLAITWYEALFGRRADIIVNEDEVMWKIADGGWLYVVRDPGRAGRALAAVAVDDLDRVLGEIVGRGLQRPAIETIDAGRKAPFVDPDGNTVTLIQVVSPGP